MNNEKEYVRILVDSLNKKIQVLDRLMAESVKQREIASADNFDDEAFEQTMQIKDELVNQIIELDEGFETIYQRIKDFIITKPEVYADEIAELKVLIGKVTDGTISLQAEEKRNKEIIIKKFDIVKKEARQVKANNKAAANYHQSMAKINSIDPQFLDKKK